MLHNFGGNIEMYGILDAISSGPIDARDSQNSTMVCYGFLLQHVVCHFQQGKMNSHMSIRIISSLVRMLSFASKSRLIHQIQLDG